MQGKTSNAFQELKIFENENVNKICDELISKVEEVTGETLEVCGSLAKIFAGELPETYEPKDVDFVADIRAFRFLKVNLKEMKGVEMIEKQPHRVILYTDEKICVEVWQMLPVNRTAKKSLYKNLIPYLYGYKI